MGADADRPVTEPVYHPLMTREEWERYERGELVMLEKREDGSGFGVVKIERRVYR